MPLNPQGPNSGPNQNILWVAFLGTVATFAVLVVLQVNPDPNIPLEVTPNLLVFGVVALTNAVLSFVIPSFMKPKAEPGKPFDSSRTFVPFVLRMAFAESVGLLGLVAAMTSQKYEVAAPFLIISFFCVAIGKPKKSTF